MRNVTQYEEFKAAAVYDLEPSVRQLLEPDLCEEKFRVAPDENCIMGFEFFSSAEHIIVQQA